VALLNHFWIFIKYFKEKDVCPNLHGFIILQSELEDDLNLLVNRCLSLEAEILRDCIKELLVAIIDVFIINLYPFKITFLLLPIFLLILHFLIIELPLIHANLFLLSF